MYRRNLTALSLLASAAFVGSVHAEGDEGAIRARAVFKGDQEKFKRHEVPGVEATECAQFGPILSEDVLITPSDPPTLWNVAVWIAEGPLGFGDPVPPEPATVEMKECRFEPHVVTLREDQALHIRNTDSIRHRFEVQPKKRKKFSTSMPKKGMEISMTFESEDDPFPLISKTFPWMKAWVFVFRHPYHAVTAYDGSVTFEAFPPGKYTLSAWHEKFGKQTKTVEVKAGETTNVDFVFEPKED